MMTPRGALFVALLLLSTTSIPAQAPDFETCDDDSDCPKGSFCTGKFDNRLCDRCVDCPSRYSRLASSRTDCSKSSLECGECLPGFEEEILTMGRKREHCRAIKRTSPPPLAGQGTHSISTGVVVIIALVVAVVAVMIGLWVTCWIKLKIRTENERPTGRDAEASSNANLGSPPSYAQATGENQPLIVGSSSGHHVFDDQATPQVTPPARNTLSLHVVQEALQTKNDATPFNLRGYRAHLPVTPDSSPTDDDGPLRFEGEIELGLFAIERAPSPTESVHSNATEPSHWQPEDHAALIEPDLDVIPEEENLENDVPHGQENADNLSQREEAEEEDERRSHPLASDSGILTIVSGGVSGRNSQTTLNDAPDAFQFNDSGLNLTDLNEQATVRSLGPPGSPLQIRTSVIRAFSSVDLSFRQDQREVERVEDLEEAQSTTEGDATKSSRKRRYQGDKDSDEQLGPALKHASS